MPLCKIEQQNINVCLIVCFSIISTYPQVKQDTVVPTKAKVMMAPKLLKKCFYTRQQ